VSYIVEPRAVELVFARQLQLLSLMLLLLLLLMLFS